MDWLRSYLSSSIGKKHIVAITGLLMAIFAIIHMLGHLIMFAGQEAYDTYAHNLQSMGALKWLVRGGLFAILMAHFFSALTLNAANNQARPVKYIKFVPIRTTAYARYMVATGLAMFVFLLFHILHFTVQVIPNQYFDTLDAKGFPDVYDAFVSAFTNPVFLVTYVLAMLFLCMHLAHGVSSAFQSLGWKHPKYDSLITRLGPALGIILFLGFITPPLATIAGVIKLSQSTKIHSIDYRE
jgi:succinate dehydrogenase / fumarate reductase cytochrome b subunit